MLSCVSANLKRGLCGCDKCLPKEDSWLLMCGAAFNTYSVSFHTELTNQVNKIYLCDLSYRMAMKPALLDQTSVLFCRR